MAEARMQLRTLTRLSAAVAAVLGVLGGVITVAMPGAGAFEQDRVVLDKGGQSHLDYDPIIGNNALTNVDTSTAINTDTCTAAGCDYIPVTVKRPAGLGPDDEYFVQIVLEWDTQELQNVPYLGTADTNDLDMYIQHDPVIDEAGPDEDGFNYKSAGSHMPEQITMYEPEGSWNIFVNNASGANTGYTLRFNVITDDVPNTIFESLPPQFSGGSFTPPTTTPPTATLDVPPLQAPVDLRPSVAPAPDQSFDGGASTASLDDQLAAATPLAQVRHVSASRPSAPSTLALLLWMIAFPLAVLAGTGALLLRRQRGMLTV
jgi:hypothetical protein